MEQHVQERAFDSAQGYLVAILSTAVIVAA